MDFERFRSDFIKILPAVIIALLVLGAIIGYGLYKKRQNGEERPDYLPAPTNIPPLNAELTPEPTNVAPLKPADIPKPTGVLPLGGDTESEGPPPAPAIPLPTGVQPI